MILALDYDDTFTKDPHLFYHFAELAKSAGWTVYGITMRYPHEASNMDPRYAEVCDKVFFTGRKAKWYFCEQNNIKVDIWIDDAPWWILRDSR